jgi:hypothetical protein
LESIPEPQKNLKIRAQATKAGGIHSLESIPGLHKRLKIWTRFLATTNCLKIPALKAEDLCLLHYIVIVYATMYMNYKKAKHKIF